MRIEEMPSAARRPAGPRRPTNLSLDADPVAEGKALGVNGSQACEQGLRRVVDKARNDAWAEERREAILQWNAYGEEHGLPPARYRQF